MMLSVTISGIQLHFRVKAADIFLENFVITPTLLLMNQILYKLTQLFNVTMSWTSKRFSAVGPRSRSQFLFLVKTLP